MFDIRTMDRTFKIDLVLLVMDAISAHEETCMAFEDAGIRENNRPFRSHEVNV